MGCEHGQHAESYRSTRGELHRRSNGLKWLGFGLCLIACEPAVSADDVGDAFPNRRAELPLGATTLGFIANFASDTMSVVDLDRFLLVTELPVGRDPVDRDGPRSTVVDSERGVVHVVLTYPDSEAGPHSAQFGVERPGYVQTLSLTDLSPLRETRVAGSPFALEITPDRSRLVVSHNDATLALIGQDPLARRSSLSILDADTLGAPPAVRAFPVCITPFGFDFLGSSSALVACVGDDALISLDLDSGAISAPFDIDTTAPQKPYAVRFDASDQRVAVVYQHTHELAVFESATLEAPPATFDVGGVPNSVTWLSPDELLVPFRDPNGAARVDLKQMTVATSASYADECDAPSEFTVAPSGQLYLVCEGNGFVNGALLEVDRETLAMVQRLELGFAPDRMAVRVP
jgi:hypothetical protein